MDHVNAEANHTLDELGIAKNAREEKIRARDSKSAAEKLKQEAENANMARLYREHVLGEKPVDGLVRLDAIRPASNNAASPINRQQQTEPVAGD
jgi:7,8-dihydro-6-hydroxymethylpterin dimethyltransferase